MIVRIFFTLLICVVVSPAGAIVAAEPTELDRQFSRSIVPLLDKYCVQCHQGSDAEAMLDLTKFTEPAHVATSHQTWAELSHRVAHKEMPPSDADLQPDDQERQTISQWIAAFRKQEAEKHAGDPGDVPVRRLSNSEYNYSVRDLTGFDIRPTREFPVDPANAAGFDNSAESLTTSPALLTKSLAAARYVAEHMVLTPDGIDFAPHPVVTETDRDKYCVKRIVEFYQRQRTDIADYFLAAWRIKRDPQMYTIDNQAVAGLSAKYLRMIVELLNTPAPILPAQIQEPAQIEEPAKSTEPTQSKAPAQGKEPTQDKEPATQENATEDITSVRVGLGPLAVVRRLWLDLPTDVHDVDQARKECEKLRDFVNDLRGRLAPEVQDLNVRGIHKGAQPFVLWKNDRYAAFRQVPNLDAMRRLSPGADSRAIATALSVPEEPEALGEFTREVERFCRIFPDVFYVSERGRDYVGKSKAEQEKGRLLSAGFHSMMGYYRDDEPLMKLMLTPQACEQLDRLWQELDFVTSAPMRQYTGFVWFERTDSSTMRGAEFDFARAEDKSVTTPEMIERLSATYLAKADALGAGEVPRAAIETYFRRINAQIQAVEKARQLAQPHHVQSLINLAHRAWRRDLTNAQRNELRSFYDQLRHDGLAHEEAIEDLLVAILMAPEFGFRVDLASRSGTLAPLSDEDVASRLSYFLWSSMPDDELRELARTQRLHDPKQLRQQVRRMLSDWRVRALATEFGGQWLDFRRFEEHNSVDRQRFPAFTDELRDAMFQEPVRFLEHVIQNDRSVLDCLYADYVIVNQPLANHYGLGPLTTTSVDGWQRVPAPADRGGLLTMGVFLTQNAPGLRTSPVKRGYWVVRRLLGERIPAPPPNVPDLPTDETQLGTLTLRETLAKHREHASCAGCHNRFDSLGLVFENYGPTGELRQQDLAGRPVDTQAQFPSGQTGTGVAGLRDYLKQHREADFADNLTRKLLSFALGRTLLLSDEPLLTDMRTNLHTSSGQFSSLIETIVLSPQFLNKRPAGQKFEVSSK
ncbi:MAG: DUF1592 domain-containing protein [Pirellulaceae bacterium]|nr:DUF1592 domain-containing protein [Pirellulaceae bacterium]